MTVTIATFEKRSPPSAMERVGSITQSKVHQGGNARRKKKILTMVLGDINVSSVVCPDIVTFYDLAETFCGLWIAIHGDAIRELGFLALIVAFSEPWECPWAHIGLCKVKCSI
jgi:hypothetical protein